MIKNMQRYSSMFSVEHWASPKYKKRIISIGRSTLKKEFVN